MASRAHDAPGSPADRMLAGYEHNVPVPESTLPALMQAIMSPESPELRVLLEGLRDQGHNYLFTPESRALREQALARDPANFLSEVIERGCVMHSLGNHRRNEHGGSGYFDLWHGCERLLEIYRPVEASFDEAATDRLLRAWTLATEFLGGHTFSAAAVKYLGEGFAVPPAAPGSERHRELLTLISRLDTAEAATPAGWRKGGHFTHRDYALLEALCRATGQAGSPALQRLSQDRTIRAQKREALLAAANTSWRPVLAALLDDPQAAAKPLELPAYMELLKRPRTEIGQAFLSSLRNRKDHNATSMYDAAAQPTGVVGNTYNPVFRAVTAIWADLETRRFELGDEDMAFVLRHAPQNSTKLLASAEWTLANHRAPLTHAALEELNQPTVHGHYRTKWAARSAAIRAKHPLLSPSNSACPAPEPDPTAQAETAGEPRAASGSRPRRGGLFGLFGEIFVELVEAHASAQREQQPREHRRRNSDFNFVHPMQNPRFLALAGADAGIKHSRVYDRSATRSREFYDVLMEQPSELDPLWTDIHVVAYSIDGKAAPPPKWLAAARDIVARRGAARHEALLLNLLKAYEPPSDGRFLGLNTLRALIYLAADRPAQVVGPALVEFALKRCFVTVPGVGIKSERLGNACLWALINLPDGGGIRYLARLLNRVKYPKVKARIDSALNEAATQAGMSRGELDELTVPGHDLDADGRRTFPLPGGEAVIAVTGARSAEIAWRNESGRTLKSPSATMKERADTIREIRTAAKEIDADLGTQLARLQRLYLADRHWDAAVWRARYLDHPLVGPFARRLVWWVELAGGSSTSALFDAERAAMCDSFGTALSVEGATIRLWHPIGESPDAVEAWRSRLEQLQLTQPFAQVWREVYALTDAERTTRTYTNRWAAHLLRQHQAMTLARINGWRATHRMWVDAPNDAPWHLTIPEHGLVAQYWVEGTGGDDPEVTESQAYTYVATDRVAFYPMRPGVADSAYGPGTGDPVPLEDISPVVFSEIMRHADLFTAVASIAADPEWLDRGAGAAHPSQWHRTAEAYWRDTNIAPLVESGKRRRAMLERIVPRLKVADRLKLDERDLIVQGTLHEYRIHLGSGACSRAGRHICIVPQPRADKGEDRIWLPFEGDQTLSIIISKALLLAQDDKITDPVILRQL